MKMTALLAKSLLLDFLYSDHERVASFLAQLYGTGAPKESERIASSGKTTDKKGGLNFGPVSVGMGNEREYSQEVRMTYDPLWSNSQKLIEEIKSGYTIDVFQPVLGQIGIISGKLLAYDLSAISNIMNAPAMGDFIAGGIQDGEGVSNRSPSAKRAEKKKEAEVIQEFLKGLPLGIGFVLVSDCGHFWFSVKRNYLSLYDLDVPLKFPTHISGIWNVLGIVDAEPGDHVEGLAPVMARNIDGLMPQMVLHMMQLTGVTTAMFGRPFPAYGLSPLIVYREIGSGSQEADSV